MPPLSRSEMEEMAFKAIMGSIGVGHMSCDCPNCTKQSKTTFRPKMSKRPSGERELPEKLSKPESGSGRCNHSHHHHHHHSHPSPDSPSASMPAKPNKQPSRNKPTGDAGITQGRLEKINSLLKAESMGAVFDVFNATVTTDDENKLVTQIQHVTKDSKTYPDSKTKIVELCGTQGIDANASFGLLAKFRHERNLLTTAILKSNTEREKALLCIKRVDDLMYMLQETAKRPKDSGSDGIMSKLSEIIMEVHDLARNPSSLYEELLDIRDEHMELLDDHDDMHQKFMDVNSCHDKLHTNHDKLQSSHTKLIADHAEARKKASLVNGLKNDVGRLQKVVDKKVDENSELKKEVERLGAEFAKVNALKHEVAQLKKKVTTLSTPSVTEKVTTTPATSSAPAAQVSNNASTAQGKKRKGKKGDNPVSAAGTVATESMTKETELQEASSNDAEIAKLKKSHDSMVKELDLLRENLAQIDTLRRAAEASKGKAIEKLQLEQATSQNWQEISGGHAEGKAKLEGQLESSQSLVSTLQSAVDRLEKTLSHLSHELTEQKAVNEKLRKEQTEQPQTTAVNNRDTHRLLYKIRAETSRLAKDIDESMGHQIDLQTLINMIQIEVHKVTAGIEKEVEEAIGSKIRSEATSVPEAVLPFTYQHQSHSHRNLSNQQHHKSYDSPTSSPQILSFTPETNNTFAHRPMIPPGFGEPSPSLSSIQHFGPMSETPGLRRFTATPSSTSSVFNGSPILSHNLNHNSAHGPIGSRLPSSNHNTINTAQKQYGPGDNATPPPGMGTATYGSLGLGNGAPGVDWSMWSKGNK